ncbi:T7SS effector LXG polymorphic toxin [Salipaludibacillus agaradhaerens]|uniref:T7SS effector LXG polymorphic toxin n=1 Tax=Salipaludibacillus agaradhaerens TaxID=76935 RepID=UPI000998D723|nr:T7SS effector LXG polymorphic toxin [Salipaludibacillus agaradhaerens]
MSMKQLDVDKVHEAIDITIQALHEKEKQIRDVEVALNNFINLEDAFRGPGGQAIRNFYATCHIPFIQFFRLFMHDYEHTLQQIKQSLDIVEPASGGFIDQAFIENDVHDGLDRVSKTTMALTDSVNDTLRSIQDIISIPLIDDSDVQQAIHVAKRESNAVVDKVLQFDHSGTASLQSIKESLRTLSKYVMEMHGAMDSGHLSVKGFSVDQLQHLPSHGTLTDVLENRASQVAELTGSYPKQRLNVLDRTSLDALARIRKIRKMQEHREKLKKIYTDVTKNGPGALQKGKQYLKDFGMISSRILLSNATIKEEKNWLDKTALNTFISFKTFTTGTVDFFKDNPAEGISMGADFTPVVSNLKAGYETVWGVDPITGRELETWERVLAGASVIGGPLLKGAKRGGKLVNNADNVSDVTRQSDNVSDVASVPKGTGNLAESMLKSNSAKSWGTLADGTNQGVKHFNNYWELYPERIPSLAKRLGVDPNDFANTVQGFENFTNSAKNVMTNYTSMRTVGDKTIYFVEGAEKAKKGVAVIVQNGKIQTMMPTSPKDFLKLQ